jgi:4-oxalocrotonate tautomerase
MPIITVQTIKGVVLQSDEQKRELLRKMTDTFISVVGELARPYTYCLLQETPVYEWSLAGRPLPDLPFLYGQEYAHMHEVANAQMRQFVESSPAAASAGAGSPAGPAGGTDSASQRAQAQWATGAVAVA